MGQKCWHFTKREVQKANKCVKRCSSSNVIRKCKSKWDSTAHLLEWLKSGTLTPPNAGEDVEPVKLSCIVGGHAKWYSHFGRQFISFYKTKHTLAIWSSYHIFWYSSKEVENLCAHQTCTWIFRAVYSYLTKLENN